MQSSVPRHTTLNHSEDQWADYIKTQSFQYRNSYYEYQTVVKTSYHYNGNPCTCKTRALYWNASSSHKAPKHNIFQCASNMLSVTIWQKIEIEPRSDRLSVSPSDSEWIPLCYLKCCSNTSIGKKIAILETSVTIQITNVFRTLSHLLQY